MKVEVKYTKHNYNAEDTRQQLSLQFTVDENQLCTFKLTEETLYDLIALINNTTATARIRS